MTLAELAADERRTVVRVTEAAPDSDREVAIDDEVVATEHRPNEIAERTRSRESENDSRLLDERPPHW